MSLEQKIEKLTAAVEALTHALAIQNSESIPVVAAAPVVIAPAPVVVPAPVAEAPVAPAPVMPALPTFEVPPVAVATAPVAAAPVAAAPFTDGKGLIAYVMDAYKAMGPAKGAQIQGVLTGLGYANINDVKPEHYGTLYAGIEALK
jgi:hypothetical protein